MALRQERAKILLYLETANLNFTCCLTFTQDEMQHFYVK